jgi:hypothetical protein
MWHDPTSAARARRATALLLALLPTAPICAAEPPRATPTRAGPVPDFAPLDRVVTSARLSLRAPALQRALTAVLGARHEIDPRPTPAFEKDDALLWLRDHQPLFVRHGDGTLGALRPRHPSPYRDAWMPLSSTLRPVPLPLIHEQGNLVTTGRHVFVSMRLLYENARAFSAPHLQREGYRPRDPGTVIDLLSHALGVRPAEIVLVPSLPDETTWHVDLILMPIDEATIMVPTLEDAALDTVTDTAERQLAHAVQAALAVHPPVLRRLGYTVVTLPMLAPRRVPSPDQPGEPITAYYTPANGLLLDRGDARLVILPQAQGADLRPGEAALDAAYRARWARAFEDLGWRPLFADTGDLLRFGGLFRCVTAVVPRG